MTDAVIPMGASFNDGQRKAMIDAAAIAPLNVLYILNEPTAASIAESFDKEVGFGGNKTVLVFDRRLVVAKQLSTDCQSAATIILVKESLIASNMVAKL